MGRAGADVNTMIARTCCGRRSNVRLSQVVVMKMLCADDDAPRLKIERFSSEVLAELHPRPKTRSDGCMNVCLMMTV